MKKSAISNTVAPLMLGLVASFVSLSAGTALGQASFQGLGDLPGGDFNSCAYGVSAAGATVVGDSSSASGTESEAFRWTLTGGMVGLGDLPGGSFYSLAYGVSADGSVVVGKGSLAPGTPEAFRWTSGGGMVGLGDLPGGIFYSRANGVSADGSTVVGMANSASGFEAFRWTSGGGMVGLGDLPGGIFSSAAHGVSADGSVVVGYGKSGSGTEAFRWTSSGGMVGLGDLPGGSFVSSASSVSADGSVVVGCSSSGSGYEAFSWTSSGGMVGLGDLPGGSFYSGASGVSADGSVIVGSGEVDPNQIEAFIWDQANGMRNLRDVLVNDYGLDLTGWTLEAANGISDDGLIIVGYGYNPAGDREAWIASFAEPTVLYVDGGSPNDGPGNDWEHAYHYLQNALSVAWVGDEIRVAEATHHPDESTANPTGTGDRTASFQLISDVEVYGGYAGYGAPDPNARDVELYETILSGDLLGDDVPGDPNFAGNDENSYHVVVGSGTDATAVLDGFTVTGGNADGSENERYGGGMYNDGGSPTITNCTFIENSSEWGGGGMYNDAGSPTVIDCTFIENSAGSRGGGMYNSDSSPTITNCAFSGNAGSGMYNSAGSPTITNCTFIENSGAYGGGMYNDNTTTPTLSNCVFEGNWTDNWGGGMFNFNGANPTLINCTFSGNSAADNVWGEGGGMYCWLSSPTVINCTFSGNSAAASGGGMLINCTIGGNSAGASGGAMLINCTISGNSAGDGGGIYATDVGTTVDLQGCTVRLNVATYDPAIGGGSGGGIYLYDGAEAVLDGCLIEENDANWGGGIHATGVGTTVDLQGCTLRLNQALYDPPGDYGGAGGGIFLYNGAEAVLDGCLIEQNSAAAGGGLYAQQSTAAISNCQVRGNTVTTGWEGSGWGAGIGVWESAIYLANTRLYDNTASRLGGGLGCLAATGTSRGSNDGAGGLGLLHGGPPPGRLYDPTDGEASEVAGGAPERGPRAVTGQTIVNSAFHNNDAGEAAGAIFVQNQSPNVVNCSFTANDAAMGGAVFCGWGGHSTFTNCVLWADTASSGPEFYLYDCEVSIAWSDVQGGDTAIYLEGATLNWDAGNIVLDPLYADVDGPDDIPGTEDDDLSLLASSPCIDHGDNTAVPEEITTDLDGRLRFADVLSVPDTGNGTPPIVDLGAYEFQCAGDLDGDGDIDLADLASLLANYGITSGAAYAHGDLDLDGDVDLSDLAALLAVYGTTRD